MVFDPMSKEQIVDSRKFTLVLEGPIAASWTSHVVKSSIILEEVVLRNESIVNIRVEEELLFEVQKAVLVVM